MIDIKLKLVPRKNKNSKYIDMVEIRSQSKDGLDFPTALVHIDTFWLGAKQQHPIYDRLNLNQEVIVKLEIEEGEE